jgi:hypothetical protein
MLAVCAALASIATTAAAATPNTWGPVGPLPAGANPSDGRDVVIAPPGAGLFRYGEQSSAFPTLTPIGAGGLGAAAIVTGTNASALPAQALPLADGRMVMSYYKFYSGPLQLTVRSPAGAYGPRYDVPTPNAGWAQTIAARSNEVLLVGQDRYGTRDLDVQSLSLAADGTLTPTDANPVAIWTDPDTDQYGIQITSMVAALDADGGADVVFSVDHISTSGTEVLELHRSPAGVWGAPHSLSAALPGAANGASVKGAVAPGGRTLIIINTNKTNTLLSSTLFRSLREPGGTFPPPVQVNDLSGPGGAGNTVLTAAGGDGTLAAAVYARECPANDATTAARLTLDVLVAAPGQGVADYGVGLLDTPMAKSVMTSVGAGGGGGAVVGLYDDVVTSGVPTNICASGPDQSHNSGTVSDRAVVVGPHGTTDHTFGGGTFSGGSDGSVVLRVDAGGLDADGNAAIVGRLSSSGVAQYAYFEGPGHTAAPPAGGGGGVTPAPGAGATPVPISAPVPPPAPRNTASPTPKTSLGDLAPDGTLTVTLTAPNLSDPRDVIGERLAVQVFSGPSAHVAVKKKAAKVKLIGTVAKTVKLRSKQKVKVKLTLTRKLRAYLKAHGKASVRLQLTSTLTGHPKTVTSKSVKIAKTHRR